VFEGNSGPSNIPYAGDETTWYLLCSLNNMCCCHILLYCGNLSLWEAGNFSCEKQKSWPSSKQFHELNCLYCAHFYCFHVRYNRYHCTMFWVWFPTYGPRGLRSDLFWMLFWYRVSWGG
jgi:hypothetical protein